MCCGLSSPDGASEWAMAGLLALAAMVLLAALAWLISQLWRFGAWAAAEIRVSALIAKAMARLSEDDVSALISQISRLGNAKPKGCLLLPDPQTAPTGIFSAVLPADIPDFPWSGKRLTAEYAGRKSECPVTFALTDQASDAAAEPSLDAFWPPYVRSDSKKRARHVFAASSFLKMSPELAAQLAAICSEAPERLLSQVLHSRGIGEDAIRVGLSPEWVQGWRSHKCRECNKPLRLIIQLPGTAIDDKLGEGVFYLFGCTRHPQITTTDQDWY